MPDTTGPAFADASWFGGTMVAQEIEDALGSAPDGTFLIRTSTRREGYSLSIKYHDIRHITIMGPKDGKYGFSDPLAFDSIPDLVSYFQNESLAHYNAFLEVKLVHPYKDRPPMISRSSILPEEEDEDIYIENRAKLRNQLGNMKVQMRDIDDDLVYIKLTELELEHKAQSQMLSMLKEQKQLQERIIGVSDLPGTGLQENLKVLKRRLVDNERNVVLLEGRVQDAREELSKKLETRRKVKIEIDESITSGQAEQMLAGKVNGTYIIRKSRSAHAPYSLSLRVQDRTAHIHINYNGHHYGFKDKLAFENLEDLCKYYAERELSTAIQERLQFTLNQVDEYFAEN